MCSSHIASNQKTCLPSPCDRYYRLLGGALRPRLLCKLRCLVRYSGSCRAIALFAFRLGQSPFMHSSRCARCRRPVRVVTPDMSGYVSCVEMGDRDQPFLHPRESECHHRSHPIQLVPFDSRIQAVQLSPYRACSVGAHPFDGTGVSPFPHHALFSSAFQLLSKMLSSSHLHRERRFSSTGNECPHGRTVGIEHLRSPLLQRTLQRIDAE
jgi:hypothetical protein